MSKLIAKEVLELRSVEHSDAARCHVLSRAVGWLHRHEDWQMAIALGNGVVAKLDEQIIATALWWAYGEKHATIGMIIVARAYQGIGIGKQVMAALLAQTQGRSLLLNATAAAEPLYAKLGFVGCATVHLHQAEVLGENAPTVPPGNRLRATTAGDISLLAVLDQQASGLCRTRLLQGLLAIGEAVVLERSGIPVGFSILRPFGRGLVVGPVVAENPHEARLLVGHWLHQRRGQFMRVDAPSDSELSAWLSDRRLELVESVRTMVRGTWPTRVGSGRFFAIGSPALG